MISEDISLYEHNEEAYNDLVNSLEGNHFSFIERATGTGKSYVLIKYLATMMENKKVLFVTAHDSMFKQLKERDMPALGVDPEIFDKLDVTLYNSLGKHKPEYYYDNYDCVIFDEAHHCGAEKWSETVGGIHDLFADSEDKKMIGATATGVRYLDDYMDVAAEYFDGNVASRLTLAQAILREILPTPLYVNVDTQSREYLSSLKRKVDKIKTNSEALNQIKERLNDIQEQVDAENDIPTMFKEYGVKQGEKYIIFCQSIDDLKIKMKEAPNWFKDIGEVEIYQNHSKLSSKENQKELDDFSHSSGNKIKLMFAVDMFNEGLHISSVDGLIMTRKTASPILYLQQIGRALSFSGRKKQVKIFDLVGNASNIDVVNNIYRDLLEEAKEQSNNQNVDSKHFNEIIDRFKIVNQGNEILDELSSIDEYISNNYIIKDEIKYNIDILENFVTANKVNFMDLLKSNTLDFDHYKCYKRLSELIDYFTIDDIIRLNSLGIIVSEIQNNKNTVERIKLYGTNKEAIKHELEDLINKYNLYYLENGNRPSDELSTNYRNKLASLGKSKIGKYLNKVSYPLNIEEKLILNYYPSSQEMDDYLTILENKLTNGKKLDGLEIKSAKKINTLKTITNYSNLNNLLNNKVFILDKDIEILKKHYYDYPDEKLSLKNIDFLEDDVKKALKNINKYAKKITTEQFKTLLEIKVELPEEINMSLEERLSLLGNYDSFYNKELVYTAKNTSMVNEFIKKNHRRPDKNITEESELYKKMISIFKSSQINYSKLIVETLKEEGLSLTEEELVYSKSIDKNTNLDTFYEKLVNDMKYKPLDECDFYYEKKLIEILKSKKYIDDKEYRMLINTIEYQKEIIEREKRNSAKDINKELWSNEKKITRSIIDYLESKNEEISSIFYDKLLSLDKEDINIQHRNYHDIIKKYNEFFEYIDKNGERPPRGHELSYAMKSYLRSAGKQDRTLYLTRLNEKGMPALLTEIYITGKISNKQTEKLYNNLLKKIREGRKFDKLEEVVYKDIEFRLRMGELVFDGSNTIEKTNVSPSKTSEEDNLLFIKEKIKENPYIEINYEKDYRFLSSSEITKLEKFRYSLIAPDYVNKIEEKIYLKNEILTEEEKNILNNIKKYVSSNIDISNRVEKIKKANKRLIEESLNVDIKSFTDAYLQFIKENNEIPSITSDDQNSVLLANEYTKIMEILAPEEKVRLRSSISYLVTKARATSVYERMIEFINKNERFPSPASDDPEEVSLSQDFQKYKMTGLEKKEINMLRKKYQQNTMEFAMGRSKK